MLPEFLHTLSAERTELLAGQSLTVREGAEPLVYILLTGCVILLNRLGATAAVSWPGDLLVAPTEGMGATMLLKAVADSVCLRARRADLLAESARQPEIALWIWEQHERREAELHRRLELLTAESVERRVLNTVADLADRCHAASPGYPMPLAQNEVADLAGATRETTSTLLNRMRRRGMVELGRRRIQVSVPDALRSLSGLTELET
jgi:CRP-like cAMP-binding protein